MAQYRNMFKIETISKQKRHRTLPNGFYRGSLWQSGLQRLLTVPVGSSLVVPAGFEPYSISC